MSVDAPKEPSEEQPQEQGGEKPGAPARETPTSGQAGQTSSGKATEDQPGDVDVKGVELGEISSAEPPEVAGNNLGMLLDIPIPVTVEVGRTRVQLEELLQLGKGSVLRLDKKVGDPVDLLLNGKKVAQGEVVAVDEQLGIRITRVLSDEVPRSPQG
jgi:flagellar motor switch protein FliN/FliY